MQGDDIVQTINQYIRRLRPYLRMLAMRVGMLGLSFCAGLAVFYLPGRPYRAVPDVWLPTVGLGSRDEVLKLPVKAVQGPGPGVTFVSAYPDGPELLEVGVQKLGLKASDCPSISAAATSKTAGCRRIGKAGGSPVYASSSESFSMNIHAYTTRGETLVAVRGIYSTKEALAYFGSLAKAARRDVSSILSSNQRRSNAISVAIRAEKRARERARSDAYKHLPFEPLLPASLPAGWVQYAMRIHGADPEHPDSAEVLYKKGPDRFIGYTMQARNGFVLGEHCGPTPNEATGMLPCKPVAGEDYYSGGISSPGYMSWYVYRPVGDIVASLYVSVHGATDRPLLLQEEDLEAQRLITKSLRPATKDKLKGAMFVGSAQDPYPYIRP